MLSVKSTGIWIGKDAGCFDLFSTRSIEAPCSALIIPNPKFRRCKKPTSDEMDNRELCLLFMSLAQSQRPIAKVRPMMSCNPSCAPR